MKKVDFKKAWQCAEIIHEYYKNKSDCYGKKGFLKKVDYIIVTNDDPVVSIWAAYLFYLHYHTHGCYPGLVSIGGRGILSDCMLKHINGDFRHEAERLTHVLDRFVETIGYVKATLGNFDNTAGYITGIEQVIGIQSAIVVTTPRFSRVIRSSHKFYKPHLKLSYYVIEQSVHEACTFYSGKGLLSGEPMLHELAALPKYFLEHAGKGTLMEDFCAPPEVDEAAEYLLQYFYLKRKIKWWELNKMYTAWQKFKMLEQDIIAKRDDIDAELDNAVEKMRQKLISEGLVPSYLF